MKNRYLLVTVFAMLGLLISCGPKPSGDQTARTGEERRESGTTGGAGKSEEVTLQTSDGFTIVGTLETPSGQGPFPACLLVHQVARDRSTYAALQEKLSAAGIASLAIDLRGHGRSTSGGTVKYADFADDRQWVAMQADLEAGIRYLREKETIDDSRLGIVGASIGANLAVLTAADDAVAMREPPLSCLLLLSPGLNYHSVQPLSRARDLKYMPVLIISGTADTQSYKGAQSLSQAARGGELRSFNGQAHGTDLFTADPSLMDQAVDWLRANLKPRTLDESRPAPPVSAGESDLPGPPSLRPGGR